MFSGRFNFFGLDAVFEESRCYELCGAELGALKLIFLRSRKLIFLKTLKTASTSFEIALSRHSNPGDVVTPITWEDELIRSRLGILGPRNFEKKGLRGVSRVKNHSTAAEVRVFVGESRWKSAQKIALVRNPYDRIISRYFWNKKNVLHSCGFEDFRTWLRNNTELISENEAIIMENGNLQLDSALRYEDLIRDSRDAVSRVGIDPNQFEVDLRNITSKSGIRQVNSTALDFFGTWREGRMIVQRHSERELDLFGYKFPK